MCTARSISCLLIAHNDFAQSSAHREHYLSYLSQTRRIGHLNRVNAQIYKPIPVFKDPVRSDPMHCVLNGSIFMIFGRNIRKTLEYSLHVSVFM